MQDGWRLEDKKERETVWESNERKRINESEELETNNFAFRANGPAYVRSGCGFWCHQRVGYEFWNVRLRRARDRVLMDYEIAISPPPTAPMCARDAKYSRLTRRKNWNDPLVIFWERHMNIIIWQLIIGVYPDISRYRFINSINFKLWCMYYNVLITRSFSFV